MATPPSLLCIAHNSGHRRAFSLIELLVALMVVATLSLLTAGVANRASEAAKGTKEIANLRAIGQSLHSYVADNAQRLPPVITPTAAKTLAVQMGLINDVKEWLDSTNLDPRACGPLISPTDPRPRPSPVYSYAFNTLLGINPSEAPGTVSQNVSSYLEIVIPSDKLYCTPASEEVTASSARFSTSTMGLKVIRYDANGKTPALFVDGHVAPILEAEVTKDYYSKRKYLVPNP